MSLDDDARAELRALAEARRLRTPRIVDGGMGPVITLDGKQVLNASSNDYLALASDRRLVEAAKAVLDEVGVGAGASRLVSGTHRHHVALESAVADWLRVDGVRVFNSGYAANVGVITTLLGPGDVIFSDELNHASLIDGCRLSRAEVVVYKHRDVDGLDRALRMHRGRRRAVVTESLFSMDGDLADVQVIAELCTRHDACWIVDEAHAIGARGPEGRGVCAQEGVTPDVLVGTFGKALGTSGAFVATTRAVADLLWNRARPFVFSTAFPAAIAAATTAAIGVVRSGEGSSRRESLASNARRLRALVPLLGGWVDSSILPLIVGDDGAVMAVMQRALDAGVFVQGIRPPTVPAGTARLRVSVSSGHDVGAIELLARCLKDTMSDNAK